MLFSQEDWSVFIFYGHGSLTSPVFTFTRKCLVKLIYREPMNTKNHEGMLSLVYRRSRVGMEMLFYRRKRRRVSSWDSAHSRTHGSAGCTSVYERHGCWLIVPFLYYTDEKAKRSETQHTHETGKQIKRERERETNEMKNVSARVDVSRRRCSFELPCVRGCWLLFNAILERFHSDSWDDQINESTAREYIQLDWYSCFPWNAGDDYRRRR